MCGSIARRLGRQNDLTGFSVEALDGSIGKIDEASNEVGASYLVVDTGPWIFGKKVMLPAGVSAMSISTRDGLRQPDEGRDQERTRVRPGPVSRRRLPARPGGYYGRGGAGYRGDDL